MQNSKFFLKYITKTNNILKIYCLSTTTSNQKEKKIVKRTVNVKEEQEKNSQTQIENANCNSPEIHLKSSSGFRKKRATHTRIYSVQRMGALNLV